MAGLIRRIEDLIVEDGEVERKTKADGMSGSEVSSSNLSGCFIGLQRLVGRVLTLVANGELGQVAVIIALPAAKVSKPQI